MVEIHGVIVESTYGNPVYKKVTNDLHFPKSTVRARMLKRNVNDMQETTCNTM